MSGKQKLAELIRRKKNLTLAEYSSELKNLPSIGERQIEPALKSALEAEFQRLGFDGKSMSGEFLSIPFLQTAHHLTPTNGPVFFANDLICLASKKPSEYYFVAANSGVAFSNPAWSGALSFSEGNSPDFFKSGTASRKKNLIAEKERALQGVTEKRISLIPSKLRDALVYQTPLPASFRETYSDLEGDIKTKLAETENKIFFSDWALASCQKLQRLVFDRDKIVYFDLNRVIGEYLRKILEDKEHLVYRLLFLTKESGLFSEFQDEILFLGRKPGKKSEKISVFTFSDFHSAKFDAESLERSLARFDLCCSTFLTFFILVHLNSIPCCGSFYQYEYLKSYLESWSRIFPHGNNKPPENLNLFSGGKFMIRGRPQYPLDYALSDRKIDLPGLLSLKMETFWEPLKLNGK